MTNKAPSPLKRRFEVTLFRGQEENKVFGQTHVIDKVHQKVVIYATSVQAMFTQLIKKHPEFMEYGGGKLEWIELAPEDSDD